MKRVWLSSLWDNLYGRLQRPRPTGDLAISCAGLRNFHMERVISGAPWRRHIALS